LSRIIGRGVAVAEIKGAPLMRLFKANQLQSEEDRAAFLRLSNISNRYRPEPDAETAEERPHRQPESPDEPELFE
jgi:hypothetical protein